MTRSSAQESACKHLGRNGQSAAITPKAAYTPIPNCAGLRSAKSHLPTFWQMASYR
ncbi:ATP-dependent nuclease subunit B [Lacticaseibacillus rhamnosus]|nr:ATP-dependent nuclease subunit B [Lacticaseibacillus rhamnosus]